MKRYLFLIFALVAILVTGFLYSQKQENIGAVDEVSATKLAEKYNASSLKDKYQLDGAVLKSTPKDDPKDMIRVEIGENPPAGVVGGTADFTPKVTISRWDEVSLSLTPKDLDKVATADKTLDLSGGKIKLGTPKTDYIIYDLPISKDNPEGGLEYQIDLKEKPLTNVIEFTLEDKGVEYFYQPELTAEEIAQGAFRPENVIGSYAVYASEQKTNWEGGKLYRTGKVGHIFRPKIIDSAGTEVWGDLHIESANGGGILSVTIPQDFLDKAVYPIRHAAGLTFGYNTIGATTYEGYDSEAFGSLFVSPEAATVSSVSIYEGYNGGVEDNSLIKSVIWLASDHTIISNGVGDATAFSNLIDNNAWITSPFGTSPSISASTNYVLGGVTYQDVYPFGWRYDTGSTNQGHIDTANNYDTPATLSPTHSTKKFSVYATYTEPSRTITTANYTYCRTLTSNNTGYVSGIATTTTGLFPLVATSTITDLKSTANAGDVQVLDSTNNTPFDIVFADEASCWAGASLDVIPHYFEKYASTTGAFTVHLGTSNISSTTAKVVTMYYGNSSGIDLNSPGQTYATTSILGPVNIYDMSVPGSATTSMPDFTDSTYNQYHATSKSASSTDRITTGIVSEGFTFDGVNDNLTATNLLTTTFSLSMWVKGVTSAGYLMQGLSVSSEKWLWYVDSTGGGADGFKFFNGVGWTTETATITDGYWHLVTVTSDGTSVRSYRDGALAATNALANASSTNNIQIGARSSNFYYKGIQDNIGIYNKVLAVGDIKTIYNNTKDSTTFWTIGSEQTQTTPSTTVSPSANIIQF